MARNVHRAKKQVHEDVGGTATVQRLGYYCATCGHMVTQYWRDCFFTNRCNVCDCALYPCMDSWSVMGQDAHVPLRSQVQQRTKQRRDETAVGYKQNKKTIRKA